MFRPNDLFSKYEKSICNYSESFHILKSLLGPNIKKRVKPWYSLIYPILSISTTKSTYSAFYIISFTWLAVKFPTARLEDILLISKTILQLYIPMTSFSSIWQSRIALAILSSCLKLSKNVSCNLGRALRIT